MPESFEDLLANCTRTALKLELRDQYMTADPGYAAWQTGNLDRAIREYAGWTETARRATTRGVQMKRARVISEPVSDYIAFEHAVTSRVNIAVGEQIRWVPRQRVSTLALPGNDVWVFDGTTLQFCLFGGDGRLVSNEVNTDGDVVRLCALAFEAAWDRGVDHDEYRVAS